LPAREVATATTFAPAWIVGWYAAVGVLVGLLFAVLALAARSVTANLVTTSAWWWLVAVVTVLDSVASGRGLAATQLGVWRFADVGRATAAGGVSALQLPGQAWWHTLYLPGAVLSMAAAFGIGLLAAVPSVRRGEPRAAVALSGATGPLLVATATVLAAPKLSAAPVEQLSALLIAPYTVLAGVAGSIAAVLAFARLGAAAAMSPVEGGGAVVSGDVPAGQPARRSSRPGPARAAEAATPSATTKPPAPAMPSEAEMPPAAAGTGTAPGPREAPGPSGAGANKPWDAPRKSTAPQKPATTEAGKRRSKR
jgi:hypothetical protein